MTDAARPGMPLVAVANLLAFSTVGVFLAAVPLVR